MKDKILIFLGFKFKVTLWFKNNPTPFIMYLQEIEYTRSNGKFVSMEWKAFKEKYQFNIDEVIALKYKTVWRPFK